ncbi:ABC transporter substrate-binding protein [Inediibacterium massiliense]|uniref:ABC transporter substrate-binding protein n=1 Tax=Inediibacterium massiliense TaxID=1658111 RepID=UPI0006B5FE9E|nr:ABC transporter substrate-binding protein [Inediibacterium massiliense]
MRKFLSLVLSFMIIFTMSACSTEEKEITVKVVGLKGPTSIGMIQMFEANPSLGKNINTSYEVIETPDQMVAKILSKEVDFAALPTNVAAKLYNKKAGYKIAAMNTKGVLYVVGNEEMKDWSDLKGKTIYSIGKGSNPDVIFRYLLKENGLSEEDVKIDYTFSQLELAQGMAAGKVNLAVLPEPFVTMVQMKNKDLKVAMDLQEEWKKVNPKTYIAQGCIVVREEFAKEHKEVVDAFLKEYKQSIDWVNTNHEQAGILTEKHGVGINAKMAEVAIPRCNIEFDDAKACKDSVNNYLKILYDFSPKDVGGKLPDENFYYER